MDVDLMNPHFADSRGIIRSADRTLKDRSQHSKTLHRKHSTENQPLTYQARQTLVVRFA